MKKFIAFVLSLAIVGGTAPTITKYAPDTAIVASAASSGTCGENLTWTLDSEGTLTISGEGDMYRYYVDGASVDGSSPFSHNNDIKKVVIEEGVTSIGTMAFSSCTSLESISIPDSVAKIGYWAFYNCASLMSINIPGSVTSIDNGTFDSCKSLASITILDSVTDIEYSAFQNCTSLTSITIPNSVTSVDYYAFRFCESLGSITILNPDCKIYDSSDTICNESDENGSCYFSGTIRGYADSTAQAYAEKYGYTFVALDDGPSELTAGDINGDGDVTVADATYIMQWAAAPDEYPLSDTAKKNGDVTGGGDGITTSDALAIQQYLSGSLSSLTVGS